MLYRDAGGYPTPYREELRKQIEAYTVFIMEQAWPAQVSGRVPTRGQAIMEQFEASLYSFNPTIAGQQAIHSETMKACNNLLEYRR